MMTYEEKLKFLCGAVNSRLVSAADVFKEFREALEKKDPPSAMEWSMLEFKAAAAQRVYRQIKKSLENYGAYAGGPMNPDGVAEILGNLKKYALGVTMNMASNPPRSTNVTANILEQEELAVWAELYKTLVGLDGGIT